MMAPADKYRNFRELAQRHRQDADYKIISVRRGSPFTVLAIHGGKIEPVTAEIARAVAGSDLNCYIFEGLKKGARDLHITSNNFDEPVAVDMAAKSRACISIHGFRETQKKHVCVGGGNARLKALVLKNLRATGLIERGVDKSLVEQFNAKSGANIVNRCAEGGVQIEVSRALRNFLKDHPAQMQVFAAAIRKSLAEYAALTAAPPPPKPGF